MIKFINKIPSIEEYNYLYNSVNWKPRDSKSLKIALSNTLFAICIYDNDYIIGMARVIGDKTIFLYLQDVIIIPSYQKRGIGHKLLTKLIKIFKEYQTKYPDIRIYLGASKDKESFYEQFGFIRRSSANLGEGMILKNNNM